MRLGTAVRIALLHLAAVSLPFLIAIQAEANQSFWFGDNIPEPPAQSVHQFLTSPQGPLRKLISSMVSFDNTEGKTGLVFSDPSKTWTGYTLLSSSVPHVSHEPEAIPMNSILVDMEGRTVHAWPLHAFPAKLLPGGHVIGGLGGGLPKHLELTVLLQMDWCGNVVWMWPPKGNPGGARWHHDFQREGNPVGYFAPGLMPKIHGGKNLVLGHRNPDPALTRHISSFPLEDDVIYEVAGDKQIVWEWHGYQHFEQMGFDDTAKEALKSVPVTVPASMGGGFEGTDWLHINAVSYLGPNPWHEQGDLRFHPDNIIWDARNPNITAIIARHDHPDKGWKSGDIVWKIGPDFSPGKKEHRLGQIIGQHLAHMIPQGLPGAGNILLLDNGGIAGFGSLLPGLAPHFPTCYRDYSRVLEFDPRSLEIVWEYSRRRQEGGQRKFFSPFGSGAQRLPNGNTLITESGNGRVFEVTREGEIVWEYISPYRQSPRPHSGLLYRAYRVPAAWVPIDRKCSTH